MRKRCILKNGMGRWLGRGAWALGCCSKIVHRQACSRRTTETLFGQGVDSARGARSCSPGAAHARDPCPDRSVPLHLASVLQDAEGGSEGDLIQEDDDENFIEEDEAGAGPVSSSVIQEDDGPREEEASAAAAASTAEDLAGGKSKFRRGGPVAKAGGLMLGGSVGLAGIEPLCHIWQKLEEQDISSHI